MKKSSKNVLSEFDDLFGYVVDTKKANKIITKGEKTTKQKETKKPATKKIKLIFIILGCFAFLCGIIFILSSFLIFKLDINKISLKDYDFENDTMSIVVTANNNFFDNSYSCLFEEAMGESKKEVLLTKGKCEAELDINDYYVTLRLNGTSVSNKYLLSKDIGTVLGLNLKTERIYLAQNGSKKLDVDVVSLSDNYSLKWNSSDEEIATVDENGKVTAHKAGEVNITVSSNNEVTDSVIVQVTNLITTPVINNSKSFLPCQMYSKEEAALLDKILFSRVEEAGKGTRAGVVAAARFLTLEFKYRLSYFLENGRLNPVYDGRPYVDGEGRYYHEGLYLSTDKYSIIKRSASGPAIWGCKIKELSYDDRYTSNGLDCSGYVSWALKNGGYDLGDVGSGDGTKTSIKDYSYYGEKHEITFELLNSGRLKAGDLAGEAGHIAIVIGVTDKNVYVAEEYYHSVGLSVLSFTYQEFIDAKSLDYVFLMDDVYKEDGNYTAMWD